MMIAMNSSYLTRHVMVSAVLKDEHPFVGGMWSLILKPPAYFRWYTISYLKFMHNRLPWYYSQGDLGEVTFGRCYSQCIDSLMKPFNLVYHALHPEELYGSSNSCYLTSEDRSHSLTGSAYKKHADHCYIKCHSSGKDMQRERKFEYLATRLLAIGDDKHYETHNLTDSQSFYLIHSEKPVMIVTFSQAYPIFQLIITLGSIIAIWFGLSVSSINFFRPSHDKDNQVTLTHVDDLNFRLDEAIAELNQLDVLFSHPRRM